MGIVIRFPKNHMVEAIAECPELGQYFLDIVQNRLREQQMTAFFSQTFGSLEEHCMQDLKAKAQWVQLRRGECLCKQGEEGDSLYWVLHGRFNTLNWDIPTIIAKGKENTARNDAFSDVTLPITSFLNHKKFDRGLKWLYGDTRIEDLWLNFFACSTNITTGQKKVHRQGYVWQAIRASAKIKERRLT